jgi:hypothetical protein
MNDSTGQPLQVGDTYRCASWWNGPVTYLGPYRVRDSNLPTMPVVRASWANAEWFTVHASTLTPEWEAA